MKYNWCYAKSTMQIEQKQLGFNLFLHHHHYSCSINAAKEVPLSRLCLTKKFALIPFLLPACWPSNNFQTF